MSLTHFTAKYPGRCQTCEEEIRVGDSLGWADDVAVHSECADTAIARRALRTGGITGALCWRVVEQ